VTLFATHRCNEGRRDRQAHEEEISFHPQKESEMDTKRRRRLGTVVGAGAGVKLVFVQRQHRLERSTP